MDKHVSTSINPSIREKDERIAKLTRAVELLQYEKLRCSFIREFLAFVSKNHTADEFLKESVLFFRQAFTASYVGIFLYNPDEFKFNYIYGSGYKGELIPEIDESGSILGETIHTNNTVIVPDLKDRYFHVPTMQVPPEYNVACVPVFTKRRTLVFRIANVSDSAILTELGSLLKEISTILASTIDHIHQNSINQQTLRGVQFSLSITRILEKTLERRDIIRLAFEKIVSLSGSAVQMIAVKDEDSLKVIEKTDPDFYLGGSPNAHGVYLKNLAETFPTGSGFIENLHKIPRWSWSNMKFYSINLTPLITEKRLVGILISVSKGEPFTESSRTLFALAAQQTSATLERAAILRQQEEYASKDGLTGLFNRRMFDAIISSETSVASRYHRALSMIILDIDHFKNFNDTYGHKTGDEVIQLVSKTIAVTIRTSDRAFRYGGEEFVIMCPETNGQNAHLVAERIRQRVEQSYTVDKLHVTVSLGVTEYIPGETEDLFTRRADSLLYVSKENGRNQVTRG